MLLNSQTKCKAPNTMGYFIRLSCSISAPPYNPRSVPRSTHTNQVKHIAQHSCNLFIYLCVDTPRGHRPTYSLNTQPKPLFLRRRSSRSNRSAALAKCLTWKLTKCIHNRALLNTLLISPLNSVLPKPVPYTCDDHDVDSHIHNLADHQ